MRFEIDVELWLVRILIVLIVLIVILHSVANILGALIEMGY